MPRRPNFPEIGTLTAPGERVSFRSFMNPRVVTRTAGQYAKRHGFAIALHAEDEPADVRVEQGTLYTAERKT